MPVSLCLLPVIGHGSSTGVSADRCREELKRLAEANCEQVRFVDRTFNYDPERAYDLIEFMIGLDTTTRFQLEVSGDILTPRLLEFDKST